MRKGFTLVEMIAVIAVLAIVSVTFAGLFTTIITDIPRSFRVIQTNTTLLNMLNQMRDDVAAAKNLPELFGEYRTNDEMLLVELEDGIICYKLNGDEITRCKLPVKQETENKETRVWLVPHAKVEWRVWRQNSRGYALEIKTYIEHKVRGHWERKMANSHLYFVGAIEVGLK